MRHIETGGGVPRPETQLLIARELGLKPLDLWPLVDEFERVA